MDYKQQYAIERAEWIEKQIEEYQRTTGIQLDAHNRGTARRMFGKEFDHWEREAVRVDNNTGRDCQ